MSLTNPWVAKTWALLYRAIVGPNKRPARLQHPDTEISSATAVVAELDTHYGSPRAAAAIAGIPIATWNFWRRGVRKPKPGRLDALRPAVRRARVPRIRETWMRKGGMSGSHIGIHMVYEVSRDTRERKIIITGWPDAEGIQDRILDAFFAMRDRDAVEEIEDVLNAGVEGDSTIEEVFDIRWFKTRSEALRWQRIV